MRRIFLLADLCLAFGLTAPRILFAESGLIFDQTQGTLTGQLNVSSNIVAAGSVTASSAMLTNTAGAGLTVNSSAYLAVSGGNVGIGTAAPEEKLVIVQGDNGAVGPIIRLRTNSFGANKEIGALEFRNNNTAVYTASIRSWAAAYDNNLDLRFFTVPDGTGPQERMRINSSGNVGMGTTAPTAKLDVQQTDTAQAYSIKIGTSPTAYHMVVSTSGKVGIGTTTPASDTPWGIPALDISGSRGAAILRTTSVGGLSTLRFIGPTTGSDVHVNFSDSTGALSFSPQSGSIGPSLVVSKAGSVGVGTGNPEAKFQVYDTNVSSPTTMDVRTPSGNEVVISTMGNVGIGTANPLRTLHLNRTSGNDVALRIEQVGQGSFVIGSKANDSNLYLSSTYSADDFGVAVKSLVLTKDGNVGIGTTGPGYKLQTEGTSALSLPAAGLGGAMGVVDQQDLVRNTFSFENTVQVPISNIALSSGAKWRAIFRGSWANNYEGGGLNQPGAYVELTSESPALSVGAITITLSRNATTGKLQAITSSATGAKYIGFSGTIEILSSNLNAGWANSMLLQGNVGIGTTSPDRLLEVSKNNANDAYVKVSAKGTGAGAYFLADSAVTGFYGFQLASAGTPKWLIGDFSGGSNLQFVQGTMTNTPKMTIDTAGNVGIGTTSAGAKLDVIQTLAGKAYGARIVYSGGVASSWYTDGSNISGIGADDNQAFALRTADINRLYISNSGSVGIGTMVPNAKLDLGGSYGANGEKFLIYNDDTSNALAGTKMGFYLDRFGANNMTLVFPEAASAPGSLVIAAKDTSGTTINPYITVKGLTGNVGIGTTSPQGKFDVSGTRSNTISKDTGIALIGSNDVRIYQGLLAGSPNWGGWIQVMRNSDALPFELMLNPLGGNVGIGTTNPGAPLEINSTATQLRLRNTAATAGTYWKIGPDGNNSIIIYNQADQGVWIGTGGTAWNSSSDRRLKTDIKPLGSSVLHDIGLLNPVTYKWRDKRGGTDMHVGFIAQEIGGVFPLLVSTGPPTGLTPDGTLSVNYTGLTPYLVKAVQELKADNEALRQSLNGQHAELERLKTELEALKKRP